jgi:competence protein ComFC
MTGVIKVVAKNIVNLVYPLRCAACSISMDPLNELGVCESCIGGIRPNPKPHCASCGRPLQKVLRGKICSECRQKKFSFARAYSACLYEGPLKEIIHVLKYKSRVSLSVLLSDIMISFVKENDMILRDIELITFVPIDGRRLRQRSFNQSGIFALNLSKKYGMPLSEILEKSRSTKPQNELSRDERLVNLTGAFRIRKGEGAIAGLNILLVDDVMTTGATLDECSKTLLNAGAASVRCLTLARGL